MKMKILYILAIVTVFALPASTIAAEVEKEALTLSRVIELSAANAPEVRLSATRIAEEEAKLAGAKVRTLENPITGSGGGPTERTRKQRRCRGRF